MALFPYFAGMPFFEDQTGRTIEISAIPRRIISTVPSQTELLFDLGLEAAVLGLTKFCVRPEKWFRTKTRIGGTKNLDVKKIKDLCPDLIIANKEENVREQIEVLSKEIPVWISDVNDLPSALEMILSLGEITGRKETGESMAARIQKGFLDLADHLPCLPLKTAYLIWKEPFMAAGNQTFIHDMLERAGFENLLAGINRYPEISLEQLRTDGCELLLLSSEPYPFGEKHRRWFQLQLPQTKVILVDGEMFSWYGSRLLHTPSYILDLWRKIRALS